MIPLFFFNHSVFAQDVEPNAPSTLDITDNKDPNSEGSGTEVKEKIQSPSRGEQLASNFIISSGFGWIKAYKTKKTTLGSNGMADFKLSYLVSEPLAGKKIYITGRYLPFNIAPKATINGVDQEYKGNVSAFAGGTDLLFYTNQGMDLLATFEIGGYKANFTELVPITESESPFRKAGVLYIAGAEFRYRPFDKFTIGPRLYLATGTISFFSTLLSASYFF